MKHENSESLSYKFQRLRERLRAAIASGELSGKLPGERVLAKQFQVNAKTLSKALTDLAAEGVLDRSIGRGTYVTGQAPATPTAARWLILTDDDASPDIIHALRDRNDSIHVLSEPVDHVRPSFINQFTAVIDLARQTPEAFVRDLVVRNLPVVAVGHEATTYSVNAVVVDAVVGAVRVTRKLLLAGHRRFTVVTPCSPSNFHLAVWRTAISFDPQATVDAVFPGDLPSAMSNGATAVICRSVADAREAMLAAASTDTSPAIFAVGVSSGDAPCPGVYVSPEKVADAVVDLLEPSATTRPAVLWLAGEFIDHAVSTAAAPRAERAFAAPAGENLRR
jgi:DNA-binding transcriptional regulator YhcF (GntR family)